MEIKINNVSYFYNENIPSIDNINLNINKDKITGIIGNGKTTLIKMLNAIIIPNEGNININKFNINKDINIKHINDLRKKIGLVFQFPEDQFIKNKVIEEISFALKNFRYKQDRIYKQVLESLIMVGLDESYLDREINTLSASEKRKVSISSILVFNPKVIILDEPTLNLDFNSSKKILKLLKLLNHKYHKTIIIASNDLDMLNTIIDDLVVLDKGKLVISGNKDDVFKETKIFKKIGLKLPKIVEFSNIVKDKKQINLKNHIDIKELMKDIYRNV